MAHSPTGWYVTPGERAGVRMVTSVWRGQPSVESTAPPWTAQLVLADLAMMPRQFVACVECCWTPLSRWESTSGKIRINLSRPPLFYIKNISKEVSLTGPRKQSDMIAELQRVSGWWWLGHSIQVTLASSSSDSHPLAFCQPLTQTYIWFNNIHFTTWNIYYSECSSNWIGSIVVQCSGC